MNLWSRFESVVNEAGHVTRSSPYPGAQLNEDAGLVTAYAFVYLPNWPYKAVGSRPKKIHVLLQSNEVYDTRQGHISRSTVQLGYFDIDGEKVISRLQLHYDFDAPSPQHPVYHLQLDKTNWPEDRCAQVGFPHPSKIVRPPDPFSNARIPTPHMGFGGALLALVADHLEYRFYGKFLLALRENESIKWATSCKSLYESIEKHGAHLHCHHWY